MRPESVEKAFFPSAGSAAGKGRINPRRGGFAGAADPGKWH